MIQKIYKITLVFNDLCIFQIQKIYIFFSYIILLFLKIKN